MIGFSKDGLVKLIDEQSSLIPILLKEGWVSDAVADDKDALIAQAKSLNIKGAHLMGVDKLKEKIAEAS